MDIPEYYRKYQRQTSPQPAEKQPLKESSQPKSPKPSITQPEIVYQADTFTMNLYEDWQDKTIFTITGPVTNGIQHNITINIDPEVESENIKEYADWQVRTLEEQLKSCRLLLHDEITLNNGIPAHRAIFSWFPTDDLRIYQEQIYILVNHVGYKITASFTKKTRQTLGPRVERMMLSFNPKQPTPSSTSSD